MNLRKNHLLTGLCAGLLFLSACGSPEADPSDFSSDSGLVPEQFMPGDATLVMAYSNQNADQYAAMQKLEDALGDEDRAETVVTEALETQFPDSGLTYESIMGAFGDQYRMVLAGFTEGGERNVYAAVTLADAKQMSATLDEMVEDEVLESKKLSKQDAYVDEENDLYMTVQDDLLFLANSPDALVVMKDQDASESLWESDDYQEALADMGEAPLFYGVMYPSQMDADSWSGGTGALASAMERQLLVLRAEEEGLRFDYYSKADKEALKELDFDFDAIPKEEPYLFEEVPAEGLMAYFESYGLAQTLMRAQAVGSDVDGLEALDQGAQSYFGMDLEEEILSFMDKGYAVALHQNGDGIFPGISLMVDVSSDEDNAQTFMNKLDGQLTGLIAVLESALPGAVEKGEAEWNGEELMSVVVDLSAVDRSENAPLPSLVTSSEIQLVYGVADGRMVLSTASSWSADSESVADSELYEKLEAQLDGVSDGLILVDAEGLAGFAASLRALREQLELGVPEASLEFENALEGFAGAIAASETKAFETHMSGFLMLAD